MAADTHGEEATIHQLNKLNQKQPDTAKPLEKPYTLGDGRIGESIASAMQGVRKTASASFCRGQKHG
jgi:hypothetical protein